MSVDWHLGDRVTGHENRVRNLAVHELGHCLDSMEHLPEGKQGIMQPHIDSDGFASIWFKVLTHMFSLGRES